MKSLYFGRCDDGRRPLNYTGVHWTDGLGEVDGKNYFLWELTAKEDNEDPLAIEELIGVQMDIITDSCSMFFGVIEKGMLRREGTPGKYIVQFEPRSRENGFDGSPFESNREVREAAISFFDSRGYVVKDKGKLEGD